MQRWKPGFVILVSLLAAAGRAEGPPYTVRTEVYFCPRGGATEAILRELAAAQREVRVQAYVLTSLRITYSLIAARQRGVCVEVLLDAKQADRPESATRYLLDAGIPTWIDGGHRIAHNKLILIDDEMVISGSFNFSESAGTENAENLLVLRGAGLAARYRTQYHWHRGHSVPYGRR